MTKTSSQMTRPFPPDAAKKRFVALRYWLLGANMKNALRSLTYNQKFFSGLRKDGVTPSFDHHIVQVNFLRPLLPHLIYPEETICVVLSHDTPEDEGVSPDELAKIFEDKEFGQRVSSGAWKMTKKFRGGNGAASSKEELSELQSQCPMASIAKGLDRIHNQQSMVGVFSKEKMRSYIEETENYILPMLKKAEFNFPEQEPAYKNIRTVLKMQIEMVRHLIDQ